SGQVLGCDRGSGPRRTIPSRGSTHGAERLPWEGEMKILRDYQIAVIAEVERAIAAGNRRIVLVAPTGSGKTIIAGEIIQHYVNRYGGVVGVAHRVETIAQTSAKLYAHNMGHGIIRAGSPPRQREGVPLASVQTWGARAMRWQAMPLPPADLVIIDECHH